MTEKEQQQLIQIAKDRLDNPRSKEEILQTFVNAGILDENGNLTEPFKHLHNEMSE